ncbi:discoidin domain-containing protein [Nocardia brasiliensis]|nr:discoidin domain-containing protein [Nocardia brasiliensis]
MQVRTPTGVVTVTRDEPLTLPTRRPDRTPTDNLARCKSVTASAEEPGRYADAAVDGSVGTGWAPGAGPATYTVDLGTESPVGRILPRWSGPAPAATFEAAPDNHTWTAVGLDPATGAPTRPVTTRYLRLTLPATDPAARPDLRELEIYAAQR